MPPGVLFSLYLISSATARFLVEFIRINPEAALGLTQAQLIAIALFSGGAFWLFHTWRDGASRTNVQQGADA